jgi:hypothetical protein
MKTNYQTGLKSAGILIAVVLVVVFFKRYSTKAYSPEETVVYQDPELEMEVFYNRPYKKEREIFGELVPYGEVWRTGANEATTFYTSEDLLVDGSLLPAGKYTLWTIPQENTWKVIFNSQMYPWGIDNDKKAYRQAEFDKLILEVPVRDLETGLEQFSIFFERGNDLIFLNFAWDETLVRVPLKPAKEAQSALLSSD